MFIFMLNSLFDLYLCYVYIVCPYNHTYWLCAYFINVHMPLTPYFTYLLFHGFFFI